MPTTTLTPKPLKPLKRKVDAITVMVKRTSLTPAPWNPPIRVQLRTLRPLMDSMNEDGFWEFCPILVDKNGLIIDGHRRWVAAGQAHIEEVPATIVDVDAAEMWATFNGTRAQVTPAQMLQAIAAGMDHIPEKVRDRIDGLTDLVGPEGLKLLAEKGVSPHIYSRVRRTAIYCMKKDDAAFMKSLLWWFVRHPRAQTMTERAIRENIDGALIVSAVENDKPLTLHWKAE